MSLLRTRWAAVGAAVAVTFGAGGVGLSQAALESGAKPVFVAITPCRLLDTRPGDTNVGARDTPLGPGGTLTLQITGAPGECSGIPADATAAAMNVTAIQGSTRSYLTLYPADATLPNASNLNWNGGDPPTPNKVDVELSPTGAVKVTNDAGTVHVAADLVGYYLDHTHDDRYYTKAQLDDIVATAAPSPIVMSQGLDWVTSTGRPTTIRFFGNATEIAGGIGGIAQLSLRGPAAIAGADYRLASVEYCLSSAGGSGIVDEVSIVGLGTFVPGDDAQNPVVSRDDTDRSGPGCHTIEPSVEVGARRAHQLLLEVVGTVLISEVTATWTTD